MFALSHAYHQKRIGSDSVSGFDECRICVSQAVDPVACGGGDIFCKGCIFEFLLKQKQDKRAQLAAWEKQESDAQMEGGELQQKQKEIEEFAKKEDSISSQGAQSAIKSKLKVLSRLASSTALPL